MWPAHFHFKFVMSVIKSSAHEEMMRRTVSLFLHFGFDLFKSSPAWISTFWHQQFFPRAAVIYVYHGILQSSHRRFMAFRNIYHRLLEDLPCLSVSLIDAHEWVLYIRRILGFGSLAHEHRISGTIPDLLFYSSGTLFNDISDQNPCGRVALSFALYEVRKNPIFRRSFVWSDRYIQLFFCQLRCINQVKKFRKIEDCKSFCIQFKLPFLLFCLIWKSNKTNLLMT